MAKEHIQIEDASQNLTLPTHLNGYSLSEKHGDYKPNGSDVDEKERQHDEKDVKRQHVEAP